MEHIKRMEKEVEDLIQKAEKLHDFLEEELKNPKFTDDIQRIYLGIRVSHMVNYVEVLKSRIEYDTEKLKKEVANEE